MLAVRPLIRQSYILSRSFYPTCPQFEEGKIIEQPEEAQSGELVFGWWMTQRNQHPFPQSGQYVPQSQTLQSKSQHT